VVEELNEPNLREILCDSYRILYRYDGRRVLIVAVWHAARRLDPGRLPE
jgi:plasmid stabilization system protein ParE